MLADLTHSEFAWRDEEGQSPQIVCPEDIRIVAYANIEMSVARRLDELHEAGPVVEAERALYGEA